MTQVETKDAAGKRDRSPAFPYIGLGKAVERIQVLFDNAKRYEARVADIAKDWGLAPKSSSTDRNVAALLAYGLAEVSGGGDARKIKVSETGWRILDDKRPGIRESLLAEAALRPRIIAEYREHWKHGRPDDSHAISQLKFEGGFTDEAAKLFLRVFDETIRFTKGSDAANVVDKETDSLPLERVKVGDKIQWTSGGVDQFKIPAEVIGLSEDGQWLWVGESGTGIPTNEVHIVSELTAPSSTQTTLPGAKAPPPPPRIAAALATAAAAETPKAGLRKEVFALDEGDVTVTYPESLSAASFHDLQGYLDLFLRKAQRRAGAGDYFVEVYSPGALRPKEVRYFDDFADTKAFAEEFGNRGSPDVLRVHLPSKAADEERRALAEIGAVPMWRESR
ncbi:MAG: hypothetical protein FJX45_02020 [Alphaproteobacteria bacterium]|nr:hypothetical protein [Alphaproteobacteria bacterium]MBM3651677.1 hypothetical protein [Alphaproteobacteria bacterium]